MECQKEHFLREGSESVYFLEEGVKRCTGENNRHLQWNYHKVVRNMGSIIRLSGSDICPLLAV